MSYDEIEKFKEVKCDVCKEKNDICMAGPPPVCWSCKSRIIYIRKNPKDKMKIKEIKQEDL